jgi:hypothetical protein
MKWNRQSWRLSKITYPDKNEILNRSYIFLRLVLFRPPVSHVYYLEKNEEKTMKKNEKNGKTRDVEWLKYKKTYWILKTYSSNQTSEKSWIMWRRTISWHVHRRRVYINFSIKQNQYSWRIVSVISRTVHHLFDTSRCGIIAKKSLPTL